MSTTLRVIQAFPSGRRTAEILTLLDQDFDPVARRRVLTDLEALASAGVIRKSRDGRWRSVNRAGAEAGPDGAPPSSDPDAPDAPDAARLTGVRVRIASADIAPPQIAPPQTGAPDPKQLLRYYRAALRDDPRGATTETADRHGITWQLVHGIGRITPQSGAQIVMRAPLESFAPKFREALQRRAGSERSLAIGWPMAAGRSAGVPTLWPVGLIPAHWRRQGETLEITVDADNVFANPDWLKGAARSTGWSEADLRAQFDGEEGVGLALEEFRARLREAVAGALRGRLGEASMVTGLSPDDAGIHHIAAVFLPTETTFTQGVVRDLGAIATWDLATIEATALGPLLSGAPGAPEARPAPTFGVGPLNGEQIAAVRNALSARFSVVAGPPGTGKSQAIVAMAASALADGQTVLVASKNHQALDAVEERLRGLANGVDCLVRTLDPATQRDMSAAKALAELIAAPHAHALPVDDVAMAALRDLAMRRLAALDARAADAERRCRMADLLDRIAVRTSGRDTGAPAPAAPTPAPSLWARMLARIGLSLQLTLRPAQRGAAPVHALRRELAALEDACAAAAAPEDPVALGDQIAAAARILVPRSLGARAAIDTATRQSLADGLSAHALSGRPGHPPAALIAGMLRHRPLWLASILGAPKRIPLAPGLFDLLIIDEASQCDIASALPLFARARRAVVVGDHNQLGFISQLGLARDRNLMEANGLAPETMARFAQSRAALFDLGRSAPGVAAVMLRDQYRSAAPIVDYLNAQFYGGGLRVAADHDTLKTPPGARPGVTWTHVPCPALRGPDNANLSEAQAIAAHLHDLLEVRGYAGSVGVIAPFRSQASALAAAINARLSAAAVERADLRIATVDSFQGQERDLIVFSPCVGQSSAPSAVQFLARDWRRLNVAISRARAVAHVFGDLTFARSGKISSLARLAAFATEPRRVRPDGVFDSAWEERVFHALVARGLDPKPQYFVAGRRLDFALFGAGGIKLDLEVDGRRWHMTTDGGRKRSDLWRDHQLRSMGWGVRRFWVDELNKDMEGCLDLVERDLHA